MKHFLAMAAVCSLLSACAHQAEHVNMGHDRYKRESPEIERLLKVAAQSIKVDSIRDERSDKLHLAKFERSTVFGDNFLDWLHSRFAQVEKPSANGSPSVSSAHVDVAVRKAYIRIMPSSLGGSVVLEVNYSCRGGAVTDKHLYRGDGTSLNWSFAHSEIMGVLNEAVNKAIVDMVQDINAGCIEGIASSG